MMETMGRKKARRRRSFTKEFKAEVVALVRQPGNSVASVARDLDLTETAVRAWVKQADVDDGHVEGLTTSEREELAAVASREPAAVARCRDPQASDGFLRQGDPVNVFPFIEAEKAEQHDTVKRSCELLEVSRSAFYEWHQHVPSARQRADDELGERIRAIHEESRGTYGWPRVHRALRDEGVHVGREHVARIMRDHGPGGPVPATVGQDHHLRSDVVAVDLLKRHVRAGHGRARPRLCR